MVRSRLSTAKRSKRFVNPRTSSAELSGFMTAIPSEFCIAGDHDLKMFRRGETRCRKFRHPPWTKGKSSFVDSACRFRLNWRRDKWRCGEMTVQRLDTRCDKAVTKNRWLHEEEARR